MTTSQRPREHPLLLQGLENEELHTNRCLVGTVLTKAPPRIYQFILLSSHVINLKQDGPTAPVFREQRCCNQAWVKTTEVEERVSGSNYIRTGGLSLGAGEQGAGSQPAAKEQHNDQGTFHRQQAARSHMTDTTGSYDGLEKIHSVGISATREKQDGLNVNPRAGYTPSKEQAYEPRKPM